MPVQPFLVMAGDGGTHLTFARTMVSLASSKMYGWTGGGGGDKGRCCGGGRGVVEHKPGDGTGRPCMRRVISSLLVAFLYHLTYGMQR